MPTKEAVNSVLSSEFNGNSIDSVTGSEGTDHSDLPPFTDNCSQADSNTAIS